MKTNPTVPIVIYSSQDDEPHRIKVNCFLDLLIRLRGEGGGRQLKDKQTVATHHNILCFFDPPLEVNKVNICITVS